MNLQHFLETLNIESKREFLMKLFEKEMDIKKKYQEIKKISDRVEYAKGGLSTQQGVYERMLFETMAVGGNSRGRLVKKINKLNKPDFKYYFINDKLSLIEKLDKGCPCTVEIIKKNEDYEVSWLYEFFDKGLKIMAVSLYEFDEYSNIVESNLLFDDGIGTTFLSEYVSYENGKPKKILYKNSMSVDDEETEELLEYASTLMDDLMKEHSIEHEEVMDNADYLNEEVLEIEIIYNQEGVPIQYFFTDSSEDLYAVNKEEQAYYREKFKGF